MGIWFHCAYGIGSIMHFKWKDVSESLYDNLALWYLSIELFKYQNLLSGINWYMCLLSAFFFSIYSDLETKKCAWLVKELKYVSKIMPSELVPFQVVLLKCINFLACCRYILDQGFEKRKRFVWKLFNCIKLLFAIQKPPAMFKAQTQSFFSK